MIFAADLVSVAKWFECKPHPKKGIVFYGCGCDIWLWMNIAGVRRMVCGPRDGLRVERFLQMDSLGVCRMIGTCTPNGHLYLQFIDLHIRSMSSLIYWNHFRSKLHFFLVRVLSGNQSIIFVVVRAASWNVLNTIAALTVQDPETKPHFRVQSGTVWYSVSEVIS